MVGYSPCQNVSSIIIRPHPFSAFIAILIIFVGTNYIGGTGTGQHEAAWRLPLALQLVPAVILGVGILFMPFSPR